MTGQGDRTWYSTPQDDYYHETPTCPWFSDDQPRQEWESKDEVDDTSRERCPACQLHEYFGFAADKVDGVSTQSVATDGGNDASC